MQRLILSFIILGASVANAAMTNPTVSNDANNIYFSYTESGVFPYNQVFIDTDLSATTGFSIAGVGAERLIENNTIYRHGGTGWSWTAIQSVGYGVASGVYKWTVPLTALGVPVQCNTPIKFIYRAGSASTADLSQVIDYKLKIGTNCDTTTPPPTPPPSPTGAIPVGSTWNYVLSVKPDLNIKVDVYAFDGFDNTAATVQAIHAAGKKAICYIDAGTWEKWRPDAGKYPASVLGATNGWPEEKWVDIRQIAILGPIMQARIDMCKSKGFDAVDFDNVDGYTNNTGFPLTSADQLTFNKFLAAEAKKRGLLVGLKNDVDQVQVLQPYFDFAINEECFQYKECAVYSNFINANKPVFNVEYGLSLSAFCPQAKAMKFSSIKKKLNLDNSVSFCP